MDTPLTAHSQDCPPAAPLALRRGASWETSSRHAAGQTTARLSAQDASFLTFETPHRPMHVGAVATFEARDLPWSDGSFEIARVRAELERRVGRIARCRQRLGPIGPARRLGWIEDSQFDPDGHISTEHLDAGGDEAALWAAASRFFSTALDRSRPLWAFRIVSGVADGRRFAVVAKLHHCLVDGLGGMNLLRAALGPSAPDICGPPVGVVPGHETDDGRLEAPPPGARVSALARQVWRAVRGTTATALNGPVSATRTYCGFATELEPLRQTGRHLDATINDLVLAAVTRAVRSWLLENRVPVTASLRAMVPQSVRTAHDESALGNRLSALFVDLPVALATPNERLAAIAAATRTHKRRRDGLGVDGLRSGCSRTPAHSTAASAAPGPTRRRCARSRTRCGRVSWSSTKKALSPRTSLLTHSGLPDSKEQGTTRCERGRR